MPIFFVMWSLSFGATNSSFRVFPLLKCTCIPYLLQIRPLLYGTVMKYLLMVLVLLFLLLFVAVPGVLFLTSSSWWPMQDICKLIKLCLYVFVPLLVDLGWNKYLLLYAIVSWSHYNFGYGMVAVPLQILVGMSGLPVYCGWQTSITFWCY